MLNNSSSILVNSDVKIDSNLFYEINAYVISYGFNKRATVTIVSCEQDELILDIQREINGLNNIKIDSGEIKVLVNYPKRYLYEGVVCEIVRKIYGYF